jgi:hypothetical protein
VTVVLNLLPPGEEDIQNGNIFSWAGKTKSRLTLEPQCTKSLKVVAQVTEPGVFDLNRVSAAVTFEDAEHAAVKIGYKEASLIHISAAPAQ